MHDIHQNRPQPTYTQHYLVQDPLITVISLQTRKCKGDDGVGQLVYPPKSIALWYGVPLYSD